MARGHFFALGSSNFECATGIQNIFHPLFTVIFKPKIVISRVELVLVWLQSIPSKFSSAQFQPAVFKYSEWSPLHLAANTGRSAIFQLIYDQIPKTEKEQNPPDDYGNTPLHFAVRSGRVAICAIIFKNVEFAHPENKKGKTPLDFVDGHKTILHFFKKKNYNTKMVW